MIYCIYMVKPVHVTLPLALLSPLELLQCEQIYPFSPNIHIQILQTDLYTFP